MAYNYYAEIDGKRVHLGASSVTSPGLFRAHPELGITTIDEWKAMVARATLIESETGITLTPDEVFVEMMRGAGKGGPAPSVTGTYTSRSTEGKVYFMTATEFH